MSKDQITEQMQRNENFNQSIHSWKKLGKIKMFSKVFIFFPGQSYRIKFKSWK